MKNIIAILLIVSLSACTSTPKVAPPTVEETTKAGFLDRLMSAANAPLFRIACPTTGCIIGSLEVGNPYAVSQVGDTAKVIFAPQRSEWGENYRATLAAVVPLLGYGIIGNAAAKVMGKVTDGFASGYASNSQIAGFGFGANGKIASMIPQPGAVTNTNTTTGAVTNTNTTTGAVTSTNTTTSAVTNTNTTTTLSGQGVIGNGQYIGPVQTTTTTTTNPNPRVCGYSGTPPVFNCIGG